jgi:SAM-dependent methyltransferase/uncharacterized protein YbaR (Trm112 family)
MVLIPLDRLLSELVCPRCRANLEQADETFFCTSKNCNHSSKQGFQVIDGCPILVDYERSILLEEEVLNTSGASLIVREESSWRDLLKSLFLTPPLDSSNNISLLMSQLVSEYTRPTVLIIGGGKIGRGLQDLYIDSEVQVIAFDVYNSSLTQFIADAHSIPLVDESVNAVIIQYVLEHVLDPSQVVSEIYRVLKKRGFVYAETPFMQQIHEGPYDFTRFTESGHRWLFKNFEVIRSGVCMGPGTQFLWSIEHVIRGIFRSIYLGKIFKLLTFWIQYLDKIIVESYSIDNASAVFLLGRKSEKCIKPKDMIHYYKGAYKRRG